MRNSTSARDEELEAMKPKHKPKLVTRKVFFLGPDVVSFETHT